MAVECCVLGQKKGLWWVARDTPFLTVFLSGSLFSVLSSLSPPDLPPQSSSFQILLSGSELHSLADAFKKSTPSYLHNKSPEGERLPHP